MTELTLELSGSPEAMFSALFDLFESKRIQSGVAKEIGGGATITELPSGGMERRWHLTTDAAPVLTFLLSMGRDVGVGLVSAYLWDKLKSRKDSLRLKINRRMVEIDQGRIARILEEEIELKRK